MLLSIYTLLQLCYDGTSDENKGKLCFVKGRFLRGKKKPMQFHDAPMDIANFSWF
jgi:hypothetical protein